MIIKKLFVIGLLWGVALFVALAISSTFQDACMILMDFFGYTLMIMGLLYLVTIFLFFRKQQFYKLLMIVALSVIITGTVVSLVFHGCSERSAENPEHCECWI